MEGCSRLLRPASHPLTVASVLGTAEYAELEFILKASKGQDASKQCITNAECLVKVKFGCVTLIDFPRKSTPLYWKASLCTPFFYILASSVP